jgi:copper chaperone
MHRRLLRPPRERNKGEIFVFKSITFEVIGDQRIVCEGCEQRVEGLLRALQGVRQVRARARNQRIAVLFDASVLEATAIAERLGTAGYQTKRSD